MNKARAKRYKIYFWGPSGEIENLEGSFRNFNNSDPPQVLDYFIKFWGIDQKTYYIPVFKILLITRYYEF